MGNVKTVVPVLVLAGFLNGCASLVIGGAASGGEYYAGQESRSSTDTTHDASITSAINSKFVNDKLVSAFDVNVTTSNGVVTLNGTVRSQAAASRAVELARSTENVRQVVSRVGVRP